MIKLEDVLLDIRERLTTIESRIDTDRSKNLSLPGSNLGITSARRIPISGNEYYINFDGVGRFKDLYAVDTVTTPLIYFDPGNTDHAYLYWDNPNRCLSASYGGDVNLQIGYELYRYVRNDTAEDLSNGNAVKITGSTGNKVNVELVSAADSDSYAFTGLLTENILKNSTGLATTFGEVRDKDTSEFNEGDPLWLSVTPGHYSTSMPAKGNRPVYIGTVTASSPSVGSISLNPTVWPFLHELGDVDTTDSGLGDTLNYSSGIWYRNRFCRLTYSRTGFVNRTDSSMSFVSGTRTFTISGTSFSVFLANVENIETSDSVVLSAATGMHYIYYNTSGTLVESTSVWDLLSGIATVATMYYNGTSWLMMDERHGCVMDAATHEYLHVTVGARYGSGFTGTFDDTSFSLSSGVFYDEDIKHSIGAKTQLCVFYRSGSLFSWTALQSAYYYSSGGNLYYDNAGTITAVPSNQYVAYYIMATNDFDCPIISIMGQRVDVLEADAIANNSFNSLSLGSLPYREYRHLYTVILRNDATPYVSAIDHRIDSALGSTTVATDHTLLTNLNSANYYHLMESQYIDLTDTGDSSLHYHSSDRSRANHTGTQAISTITDLQSTLDGKQPYDTDLVAIAGLTGTGFAVQTSIGFWSNRSIATSGNAISVSNGDGVSGNPTLSLSIGAGSAQVAAGDHNHTGIYQPVISGLTSGYLPYWNGSALANTELRYGNNSVSLRKSVSSWGSNFSGYEVGNMTLWANYNVVDGYGVILSNNRYHNGSENVPTVSGSSSSYEQDGNSHSWYINNSLSAGVGFTPSEKMRLYSNGCLELNTVDNSYNGGLRVVADSDHYAGLMLGCSSGGSGTQTGQWGIFRSPLGIGHTLDLYYTDAMKARFTIGGDLILGPSDSASLTASPRYINLGKSYSDGTESSKCKIFIYNDGSEYYGFGIGANHLQYHTGNTNGRHDFYNGNVLSLRISNTLFEYNNNTVWHAGNDGSGSGLDADTLDGYHASSFQPVLSLTQYYLPVSNGTSSLINSNVLSKDGTAFIDPIAVSSSDYNDGLRIGRSTAGYSLISLGAFGWSGTLPGQWTMYSDLPANDYKLWWNYYGTNMMSLTNSGDFWVKTGGGDGIEFSGQNGTDNNIISQASANSTLNLIAGSSVNISPDGVSISGETTLNSDTNILGYLDYGGTPAYGSMFDANISVSVPNVDTGYTIIPDSNYGNTAFTISSGVFTCTKTGKYSVRFRMNVSTDYSTTSLIKVYGNARQYSYESFQGYSEISCYPGLIQSNLRHVSGEFVVSLNVGGEVYFSVEKSDANVSTVYLNAVSIIITRII